MGAIITKLGLKKIASATVDNPLKIEKFALGDGGGNEIIPNADMKSLVGEKYRDFINDKYANNTNTVFESVLRANAKIEKGFYIRELGLFDESGDLIVVTEVPLQYRAATKEGNILTELLFNVVIQVDNADVIEIKLNEQAFATVDALHREKVERVQEDINTNTRINNLNSNQVKVSSGNFPNLNNTQEALDSLKTTDKALMEMDNNLKNIIRDFYKMFLGVAINTFNHTPFWNPHYVEVMWCSGQLLKVVDYPELYAVLGTRWGGEAGVNFNLPNTHDRVLRTVGSLMPWTYQEDAMQNITASLQGFYWKALNAGKEPIGSGAIQTYAGPDTFGGDFWAAGLKFYHLDWSFDASRVVRVANETRVKSLGVGTLMVVKVKI